MTFYKQNRSISSHEEWRLSDEEGSNLPPMVQLACHQVWEGKGYGFAILSKSSVTPFAATSTSPCTAMEISLLRPTKV